ncbi:hypothetical protein EON73_02305 [bacterium]|nr:MAG: hypothetical protein EON73_02305 [bacterium]
MSETHVDKIELLLKEYLWKTTNYVIMLTASWGAGKTYFLKNKLFPNLQDTGYQGIHVSLFGVTTIDEIKDKIYLELYPILDNKILKASSKIFKAILKSADVTKLMGKGILSSAVDNVSDAASEISKQKFDFVDLEKLLICFDDLERVKPEMLSNNQILGYINSLVEDSNIKAIIVANEGKLNELLYSEVKEKIIGNTIHFQQNFFQVFENILQSLQNPTDAYLKHLKKYQNLIYDLLMKENNEHINYRTLSYFLSNYSQICHAIQSGFNIKDLDEKKKETLEYCLKFSLMVCVEYKKGKISFRNKSGVDVGFSHFFSKYINKDDKPTTYTEKVIESYFQKDEYTYYNNLYNYLTGGDTFNKDFFKNELCEKYHIVDQNISESYKIYNKLSSRNYQELTDKEYTKLTRKLKDHALKGEYLIQDYITVFYFIARNDNVLNLDLQKLINSLIKAIKKLKTVHVYSPVLARYAQVPDDNPFYKYSVQLRQIILEINEKVKVDLEKHTDSIIEQELEKNYLALHESMIKDIQKPLTRTTLSGIKPLRFYQIFKKADNAKRSQMLLLFRIIYHTSTGNNTKQDLKFMTELEKIVNSRINKVKSKNVSGSLFMELQKEVKKSRNNIGSFGSSFDN